MNSPTLKTLFRNLLADIPSEIDLTELTPKNAGNLDKILSILQHLRTEESDPVVIELESLIDQIHIISGEYLP